MAITTEKAYEILSLPLGASKDEIKQSYKNLAPKWHPEMYKDPLSKKTEDVLKKFKLVNLAYRKLIHNNEGNGDITLNEMFEQYRQVFNTDHRKNEFKNGKTFQESMKSCREQGNALFNNWDTWGETSRKPIAVGKRLVMVNQNKMIEAQVDKRKEDINKYDIVKSIDTSKFYSKKRKFNVMNNEMDDDPMYTDNRHAVEGCVLAKQGDFVKAIENFTKALKFTSDKRLFSNRSYCYHMINRFQDALSDAEKAIEVDPNWLKGYARKFMALKSLERYKEADEAYDEAYMKEIGIDDINDPDFDEERNKIGSIDIGNTLIELNANNNYRAAKTSNSGRKKQLLMLGKPNNSEENNENQHQMVRRQQQKQALDAFRMYSDTDAAKSTESCSDMDNNELDNNENDSENGEDSLSAALLNKKLQPTNLSKQLLKQQAAASASALATGWAKSGSTISSSDASSSTSSKVTLNQPTTTTKTSKAPSTPSYLTTPLSNPRSTPQSPLAAQRSVAAAPTRPGKSQSPPSSHSTSSNINNTNQRSSSSINSGRRNMTTTSLLVRNVDSSVNEKLDKLFSAYGDITIEYPPNTYCAAIIKYKSKKEACLAMIGLQDATLEGQILKLEFLS